jgi:hypothetical protein
MLQVNVLLSLIFTTSRIYTSHPSTDSKTTHILFTPPVNIYTTHRPSQPSLFTSPTLIYNVVVVGGLTGLGIGTGENTAIPPELAPHLTKVGVHSKLTESARRPRRQTTRKARESTCWKGNAAREGRTGATS